jgi:hypothetical protein
MIDDGITYSESLTDNRRHVGNFQSPGILYVCQSRLVFLLLGL